MIFSTTISSFTRTCFVSIFFMANIVPYSHATSQTDSLDKNVKALNIINDFASGFCGQYMTSGSKNTYGVESKAKAELKSVLKKLADVDVKFNAYYNNEEYVGVL